MSNYKKYIRVNNDWEELCPEVLGATGVENYDNGSANSPIYLRTYRNLTGTSSSTATYASSSSGLTITVPNLNATGVRAVTSYGLYGSTLSYDGGSYPFSSIALTYTRGKDWFIPIESTGTSQWFTGDGNAKVIYGHQGYIEMSTSNWPATGNETTGTGTYTINSWPAMGYTFVGKVAQTTESNHTVHRITLGYGQDGLDITPFYNNPTNWRNFQDNAHFRIKLQSTSGLTSAPYITYLRIPYYNGSTATYTDFPIRVDGDSTGTVDIRELGGYYLDVTFSDNAATGFAITNLLPDGDLVDY